MKGLIDYIEKKVGSKILLEVDELSVDGFFWMYAYAIVCRYENKYNQCSGCWIEITK